MTAQGSEMQPACKRAVLVPSYEAWVPVCQNNDPPLPEFEAVGGWGFAVPAMMLVNLYGSCGLTDGHPFDRMILTRTKSGSHIRMWDSSSGEGMGYMARDLPRVII